MADSNPILNNPYEEPRFHYATTSDGELDFERIEVGRRVFSPELQAVPINAGTQREISPVNEAAPKSG
jgi:type III restriction enzyme